MKELCLTTYKNENYFRICILNYKKHEEEELSSYLKKLNTDIQIINMDTQDKLCNVFEISSDIKIEDYLRKFARKYNYTFYKEND